RLASNGLQSSSRLQDPIEKGIGAWTSRGTHTVEVKFLGDETYDPCSTGVYYVTVVGGETLMDIFVPSPDVGIGEPFYAWGYLKKVLQGPMALLDKTVELYADGVKVRDERTGSEIDGLNPGRYRFAVPAPQTLGAHTVEVRFAGDDIYEPCSSGIVEFNAVESGVVATIENLARIPTKVEQGEGWSGYFYLCNRGTGAGNVRAVISGDIEGETPIITMNPGDCQTIAFGAGGPARFTIRTG
ncbi:unnamed protein product, partial [marine sediment metagenome]